METIVGIFLDFTNAFSTVDHTIIFDKSNVMVFVVYGLGKKLLFKQNLMAIVR